MWIIFFKSFHRMSLVQLYLLLLLQIPTIDKLNRRLNTYSIKKYFLENMSFMLYFIERIFFHVNRYWN